MRRWTDGKSWSASRVSGSFLTYREMEGKRGNGFASTSSRKTSGKNADGSRTGDSDQDGGEDGPDGYRYKPDGLMKQSFSITTSDNRHLHLISYYSRPQGAVQPLKQPTNDPALRNIRPQKGMYPEATVNDASSIPAVTRGPMTGSPYSSAPPVGHPYGYPPPGPPGYMPQAYPPGSWPSTPTNTPPSHYAPYPYGYPVTPGYPPAPYPHHQPPPHYPSPTGPTQFDRAPPPPAQTHLPIPLQSAHSSHAPPPAPSYAPNSPPRVHTLPPYAQPTGAPSSLQPNPYSSSTIEAQQQPPPPHNYPAQASNGIYTGYHNGYYKPPTPPTSTGVTPQDKPMPPEPLAATREVSAGGGGTNTPTKMIPSINALINGTVQVNSGDGNGERVSSRAGSRSPASAQPFAKDPDMMAAGGFQKGQYDLKRLDTQMFKF